MTESSIENPNETVSANQGIHSPFQSAKTVIVHRDDLDGRLDGGSIQYDLQRIEIRHRRLGRGDVQKLGLFNIGIKTVAPGIIKSQFGENAIWSVSGEYKEDFQRSMAHFDFQSYFSTREMIASISMSQRQMAKKLRYVAGKDVNRHFTEYQALGDRPMWICSRKK